VRIARSIQHRIYSKEGLPPCQFADRFKSDGIHEVSGTESIGKVSPAARNTAANHR